MRALFLCLLLTSPLLAQPPESTRLPVLFDTTLGSDIDQPFALALLLASPEFDVRGVTTVSGDTNVRALMACRFLTMTGRRQVQVAAGAEPQAAREINPQGQYRYYYHPDVLFNRTTRPTKESAVDFLFGRLKGQPAKTTLIAAGPLTNIARLLVEKPESSKWIKRIVFVGGAPGAETADLNVGADVAAAQAVLKSGVPITVLPMPLISDVHLQQSELRRIFAPGTALSLQVEAMHQLWDQSSSAPIAAALAVGLCLEEKFATLEECHLEIDEQGLTRISGGKPNARVAVKVHSGDFVNWYVERMSSCVPPARHPSKLIAAGSFPHRVHVAEDYENDIERFWWMSGKAEAMNVPPGSRRACRGTLTHDFDDLLGNPKAMDTAVIFNPVPGPPMGKQPRLSFRYWLKGTDTLRVQIYSLTNGYHRQLYLTGLMQGRWESAAVDMTAARRPDGTGGPLSEHERIDDIQFYVAPTAELLIDDVVLYDAATANEKRSFPRHIHFTSTFDTGNYGKHWIGDFEVVPDKGYFWRAARSVDNDAAPWIRLNLRGERTMGATTKLFFRYFLSGADSLQIALANRTANRDHVVTHKAVKQDAWVEAFVEFANGPSKGDRVDELRWLLPKGAELYIDDVLLYEP